MRRTLKFSKTASAQLQYKINMSIIFHYIRQQGPITRANVARDLNISAPAVSRVIERLSSEGYVVETGKAKSKTGKKPILLKTNDHKGFVVGIDLGRDRIRCRLSNFSGLATKNMWGANIEDSENILEKLHGDINRLLEEKYKDLVKAICIGVPAVIDEASGRITSAPLYDSWKNLDIGGYIENIMGVPVYMENNVNLAALAEKNYGQGQKFDDIFYIEIGNGIGGGIIADNHLWRGSDGSAGEIGFSIVSQENLGFRVQSKGFLEKHASVTSLKERAINAVKEGRQTVLRDIPLEKLTPEDICKAALQGDDVSNSIIEEVNRLLAVIITNAVFLLNPQIMIIGGDVCTLPEAGRLFVEPITRLVKDSVPFGVPDIQLSLLEEDAGVIGASFMAMEALLVGEFPYKISQKVLA